VLGFAGGTDAASQEGSQCQSWEAEFPLRGDFRATLVVWRKVVDVTTFRGMIRITEHIEFSDYTAYECPTCLEQAVLVLAEKWQICPSFHFTLTAPLIGSH
jgi:hypothetical protein